MTGIARGPSDNDGLNQQWNYSTDNECEDDANERRNWERHDAPKEQAEGFPETLCPRF
jgi:hypothetical protein